MPFSELLPYVGLVIALYGALLSTAVALKQNRARLLIRAEINSPHETLIVEVFNPSGRRSVMRDGEIRYGVVPEHSKTLILLEQLKGLSLEPGQGTRVEIQTKRCVEAAQNLQIHRQDFSRIWILVHAYGRKTYTSPAQIDAKIINQPFDPRAKDYIAADLALGFKQTASRVTDLGRTK